eukprot:TRINITY_DN7670_c0_g1_i1.p2 TRINITY_DN7670_c0_g1~~TRINITY_DN7670_c0_g1_i1.p2  ORF type:complete len:61 (+),score=20.56 TRINITY_DN7670_c0_g1_i1:34-216(+)
MSDLNPRIFYEDDEFEEFNGKTKVNVSSTSKKITESTKSWADDDLFSDLENKIRAEFQKK